MITTQKHFELFQTEAKKWIDRFELNNWKIEFVHEDINDDHGLAECNCDLGSYCALITLNSNWENYSGNIEFQIKKTAKHEILHILTAKLRILGRNRFVDVQNFDSSEEELVRKLENIIQ